MRKSVKISLLVIGIFIGVVVLAIISMDIWVTRVANNAIRRSLSDVEGTNMVVSVGDIHVGLLTGMVDITNIYMATDTNTFDPQAKRKQPGMEVAIPHLTLEFINYFDLLRKHEFNLFGVTVHHPRAVVWIDERYPERCLPVLPKDTSLSNASEWIHGISLSRVRIVRATAHLNSIRTPLELAVDSLSAQVNGLSYSMVDSLFTYSDSTYSLTLDRLYLRTPDGLSELDLRNLNTEDAGPLTLGYTRFRNIVDSKRLADKANEPTTWIDLTVRSLATSPVNPIRKAIAKDYTLDSIFVDVQHLHAIRDERHAPKHPFPTPQQVLMELPATFEIRNAKALVRAIDVDLWSTDNNCGKIHLEKANALLRHVTNRKNAIWTNYAEAPMGENGHVTAMMALHMNKDSQFDIDLQGHDVELGTLNSLLRPLVGITFESHMDKLDVHYSGDKNIAKGEFLMMYHGLDVKVHKEDKIPYRAIQQNAGFIQSAANNLIPKSNPTAVDIAPRRYYVTWKNDPWKPYPLYLFGPCIDGVLKTMLPGLNVHKQVKQEKTPKR